MNGPPHHAEVTGCNLLLRKHLRAKSATVATQLLPMQPVARTVLGPSPTASTEDDGQRRNPLTYTDLRAIVPGPDSEPRLPPCRVREAVLCLTKSLVSPRIAVRLGPDHRLISSAGNETASEPQCIEDYHASSQNMGTHVWFCFAPVFRL